MRHMFIIALGTAAVTAMPVAASPIEPGRWEVQSRVVDLDMPGAPPQVANMMKSKPQTHRHCLTPEEASAGPKEMLKETKGECKYTKYEMAGGKIDAAVQCTSKDTGQMNMTIKGAYTKTSYNTRHTMKMNGPMGPMTIISEASGRHVGACK